MTAPIELTPAEKILWKSNFDFWHFKLGKTEEYAAERAYIHLESIRKPDPHEEAIMRHEAIYA